jgi:hypothetical protein
MKPQTAIIATARCAVLILDRPAPATVDVAAPVRSPACRPDARSRLRLRAGRTRWRLRCTRNTG